MGSHTLDNGAPTASQRYRTRKWHDSVRTPDFHHGKKRSILSLPMNDHLTSKVVESFPRGTHYRRDRVSKGIVSTWRGDLGSAIGYWLPFVEAISQSEMASMDARARNKLRLKLKDQAVNLAQTYAERRQLERMFINTVSRVVNCVTNLRKFNYSGAARSLGVKVRPAKRRAYERDYVKDQRAAVANGWLELQYGWQPLLNDLYGSAKFIADKYHGYPKSKLTVVEKDSRDLASRTIGNGTTYQLVLTSKTKYIVKYTVYFSVLDTAIQTMKEAGLTNPALLAWELLPFSFVVDWFFPIGNALSSIDATLGLRFEKGCVSTLRETQVFGRREMQGTWVVANAYHEDAEISTATRSDHEFKRVKLLSFPWPALPQLKNPFSPTHAANAMALLHQTFKR